MVRVDARGGETIAKAAERAVEIAKVAGDRVQLVFNGLMMDVSSDPAKNVCILYDVLHDLRNEHKIKLPSYYSEDR
jgi:propanediol dehydratase small subunit